MRLSTLVALARGWLVPAVFAIAAVLTAISAAHSIGKALSHPTERAVLIAVYHLLRTAVAIAFTVFTARRAEPHRRSREALPLLACVGAMAAILAFSAPARTTPSAFVLAGDVVAVAACVWLLAAVLALGRCFGVLPEARGLVTRGPYRLVRHPVYLGELAAGLGLALAAPSAGNAAVLAAFFGAQLLRMGYEERALTDAFPQYARYAQATPRLLPRLRVPGLARTMPRTPARIETRP